MLQSHIFLQVAEGDRTPAVIRRCLIKHHINEDQPMDYELVQILPNGSKLTTYQKPFRITSPPPP